MSNAYERCIEDSPAYQRELEKGLENQKSDYLIVFFKDVAYAFPDRTPNPYSFDIPQIDDIKLKHWANERGWSVQLAPEKASEGRENMPPVRFTKMS